MSRRPPLQPPVLDGYEHIRLLGSGGYSDVFLYQQNMPRREVAVKVLVETAATSDSRQRFDAEANTLAALSTHPYIVTIFHAAVASSGHPFMVLEYCPGSNYLERARTEQMSVAEVLRTGIQISGALETVHRAQLLHRDIKPANILTTEYGWPALTDFGIASTMTESEIGEAVGMSIPWSPKEIVADGAQGDHRSDIYSLAATIYTLLTGRSPFEIPGGSNRSLDLIDRIGRDNPQPIGRGDVPQSFERLLRQALAKDPNERPNSVAEFARSLQHIESELGLAITQLEVRGESTAQARTRREIEADDDKTNLKRPTVIGSQPPLSRNALDSVPSEATMARSAAAPQASRPSWEAPEAATIARSHFGSRVGNGNMPPSFNYGDPSAATENGRSHSHDPAVGEVQAPKSNVSKWFVASLIVVAISAGLFLVSQSREDETTEQTLTSTIPPASPPDDVLQLGFQFLPTTAGDVTIQFNSVNPLQSADGICFRVSGFSPLTVQPPSESIQQEKCMKVYSDVTHVYVVDTNLAVDDDTINFGVPANAEVSNICVEYAIVRGGVTHSPLDSTLCRATQGDAENED